MGAPTSDGPFTFDPAAVAGDYASQGWAHSSGGLAPWVFDALVHDTKRFLEHRDDDLENWRFPGKKNQFLWELPDQLTIDQLCAAVADVTGFAPEQTTLAERHVKIYGETAPEMPPAHKDRSASEVAVLVGIDVPPESRLMLWPFDDREPNPYPTSAEWRASRRHAQLPEVVLEGVAPVEVDLRAGDVVLFKGAEIYHERYRPANTTVLALKFSGVGLDPLGEDPRTVSREAASAAVYAAGLDTARRIELSPRVVGMRVDEYFPSGARHTQVRLLERDCGVSLTDAEVALIRRLQSRRSLATSDMSAEEMALAAQLIEMGVLLAR